MHFLLFFIVFALINKSQISNESYHEVLQNGHFRANFVKKNKNLVTVIISVCFQMANIPISDKCLDLLIQKMDLNGDGEIDFA